MIRIRKDIDIPADELHFRFVRASGPGGQNVNKVATAVQLHFDVRHSPSLPDQVKSRLLKSAGRRITRKGELVIDARRYRSQERNREDAVARLVQWIERAARPLKPRRPTRPTRAAVERRLEAKRRRAQLKRRRSRLDLD